MTLQQLGHASPELLGTKHRIFVMSIGELRLDLYEGSFIGNLGQAWALKID